MTLENYSAAVPVIATADVAGTVRYIEHTLGFEQQWIGATLLFTLMTPTWQRQSANGGWRWTFLWANDIDRVYVQHRAKCADIAEKRMALGHPANMWRGNRMDTV